MTRTRHSSINVRGFLRNARYPRGYVGVFEGSDGSSISPVIAREFLFDDLAKGHRVIPTSLECGNPCKQQGCDGFDFGGGGCPGYEIPETSAATP